MAVRLEPKSTRVGMLLLLWLTKIGHTLYAKGMATRGIVAAFKKIYNADVSPALIFKVTDASQ